MSSVPNHSAWASLICFKAAMTFCSHASTAFSQSVQASSVLIESPDFAEPHLQLVTSRSKRELAKSVQ